MLTRGESKLHDGTVVNTVSYNMEGLLKLSVEKYLDIVGHDTKLRRSRHQASQKKPNLILHEHPLQGKRPLRVHGVLTPLTPSILVSCIPSPNLTSLRTMETVVLWRHMQRVYS